jgi:hypothetical protein
MKEIIADVYVQGEMLRILRRQNVRDRPIEVAWLQKPFTSARVQSHPRYRKHQSIMVSRVIVARRALISLASRNLVTS